LGSIIPVIVNLGEWVVKSKGSQVTNGSLKVKTIQVNSEEDSSFSLIVNDIKRGTARVIPAKHTIDRRPMIYGDSRNIEIIIASNDDSGFRINSVALEGSLVTRNKRIT